ncbi:MAG: hypothetical protein K8R68_04320, partial [Bacteroidales bacterium]|nr:hypothetical protein [Bacteroidales bacterium]
MIFIFSSKTKQLLILFIISILLIFIHCANIFENKKFERFANDFINWYVATFPVESALIENQTFDIQLDDYRIENIKEMSQQLEQFADRIALIDSSNLSIPNKTNFIILSNKIKIKQFELNNWHRWQHDAVFYTQKLQDVIYGFSSHHADSIKNFNKKILTGLKKFPDFIFQAQKNLTSVNSKNSDYAIEQIEKLQKIIDFQLLKNS